LAGLVGIIKEVFPFVPFVSFCKMNPLPLAQAQAYAAKLVEWLSPHCERIEIAGSIRRQRPQCNDVDLVVIPKLTRYKDLLGSVTATQNHAWLFISNYVANYRAEHPENKHVRITAGHDDGCKQMTVMLTKCQLDVWFAETENFGTRFLFRTGSKEHNIWLCGRASERYLDWEPYKGLRKIGSGEHLPATTEAEIYGALGLEPIDPKNRERDWIHKNLEFGL
jgi:DNA polymerase/3'-5' exonuclease PolX